MHTSSHNTLVVQAPNARRVRAAQLLLALIPIAWNLLGTGEAAAQFGGTLKDITTKFEEPMPGGPFVNDIEGVVPKFAAGKNNKPRT